MAESTSSANTPPATRAIKVPGPDHPITIDRHSGRITVSIAGREIGRSERALTLREASYPPVYYIPRADVDMSLLERTRHSTHCPYKGDCSYYSIPLGGPAGVNAVWTYEHPHAAVAAIKDHLAFYPNRVQLREE